MECKIMCVTECKGNCSTCGLPETGSKLTRHEQHKRKYPCWGTYSQCECKCDDKIECESHENREKRNKVTFRHITF